MEEDIKALLEAWHLEGYVELFANVLSDKHRDPFSSISNIEMFQLDNENKTCESIVLTSSPIASTGIDNSLWDLQTSSVIESTGNYWSEVFQSKKLLDILQSSVDGRLLLSLRQEDGLLNCSSRRKLCNIIIKYLLGDDPKMATIPSAIFYDMAFQINV